MADINVRLFSKYSYIAIFVLTVFSALIPIQSVLAQAGEDQQQRSFVMCVNEETEEQEQFSVDEGGCPDGWRERTEEEEGVQNGATADPTAGSLGTAESLGIPRVSLSDTEGILNAVFLIVGSLSLVFIVIGAARFVLAGGNPDAIAAAKNTVLYAVIGLAVAILASVVVNFIISSTA